MTLVGGSSRNDWVEDDYRSCCCLLLLEDCWRTRNVVLVCGKRSVLILLESLQGCWQFIHWTQVKLNWLPKSFIHLPKVNEKWKSNLKVVIRCTLHWIKHWHSCLSRMCNLELKEACYRRMSWKSCVTEPIERGCGSFQPFDHSDLARWRWRNSETKCHSLKHPTSCVRHDLEVYTN